MSNLDTKRSSVEENSSDPSTTNEILREPEQSMLREPSVKETIIIICVFGGFLFMCTGNLRAASMAGLLS